MPDYHCWLYVYQSEGGTVNKGSLIVIALLVFMGGLFLGTQMNPSSVQSGRAVISPDN